MTLYPSLTLTLLNGFLLVLPLFALRFGLPSLIRKTSLAELDHFPPLEGRENIALRIYFITNTFLIFSPLLAQIKFHGSSSWTGWFVYLAGVLILGISLANFSATRTGFAQTGLYRFSRNPIYIGYFLFFIGVAMLIGSWTHLAVTLFYQISVHYLILSEERWCKETFGKSYADFAERVRRYL